MMIAILLVSVGFQGGGVLRSLVVSNPFPRLERFILFLRLSFIIFVVV